jgi:hypothetical protein
VHFYACATLRMIKNTQGGIIARCPFCSKILSDQWLKRQGAAMMGKARGKAKARAKENAVRAARERWDNDPGREQHFRALAALAGVRQPKRKYKPLNSSLTNQ